MKNEVFIVGAVRSGIAAVNPGRDETPNTSSISSLSPDELAEQVVRSLFKISGISPDILDCFVLGSAISQMLETTLFQAPAKYVIRKASDNRLPKAVGIDVEKACSTGLAAIWCAAREIMLGNAEISIGGGVDMMSRRSNDTIILGLTDPITGKLMVELADLKAKELGFSAESHDNYAKRSFALAHQHLEQSSIVPIKLSNGGLLTLDEVVLKYPPERIEKLQKRREKILYPGCEIMTLINSSKYGDAAAFIALASKKAVQDHNLKPLARIVSFGVFGGKEPKNFVIEPFEAICRALDWASLSAGDIDLFEVNEAFPTPCLYLMDKMKIPREKINPWGGAIAHGHPIGATGAILLTKAITILIQERLKYAVISLCNAVDEATAMVIERITNPGEIV